MPNVTIGDLAPSNPLTGGEKMEVEQVISGVPHSRRTTAADVAALTTGLPDQSGHGGQFLTTDGIVASWGTPAPAGANMYVQFNDGGAFGADPALTYDRTAAKLRVPALSAPPAYDLAISCESGQQIQISVGANQIARAFSDTFQIQGTLEIVVQLNVGFYESVSGTLGFLNNRLAVYTSGGGTLLGYIPIYNTIT